MDLVSVVIPTFNRCKLLIETINSVLNQKYEMVEIFVIDDGSNDNTKKTVLSISDKRINYLNYGKIGDVGKLRNLAIKKVKGKYLAFCDDDDIWHPDKLITQLTFLNQYDIICSNANVINEKNQIIKDKMVGVNSNLYVLNTEKLLRANLVITSSIIINQKFVDVEFIERGKNNSAEDYELWLRLSKNKDILFINKPLVSFRKHSNTSSYQNESNVELERNVIEILSEYRNSSEKKIRNASREGILWRLINLSRYYAVRRKYLKYLHEVFKMIGNSLNKDFVLYKFSKFLSSKR